MVVAPAILGAREVDPLGVAEFVPHEVQVALSLANPQNSHCMQRNCGQILQVHEKKPLSAISEVGKTLEILHPWVKNLFLIVLPKSILAPGGGGSSAVLELGWTCTSSRCTSDSLQLFGSTKRGRSAQHAGLWLQTPADWRDCQGVSRETTRPRPPAPGGVHPVCTP